MINLESIKEKIINRHGNDEKQLEVIFSKDNRIIVEAPAGFGKTNTMISKIAYMIASNQIPYPKKLLALTFSVNASYKIKKDVLQQLPNLLSSEKININEKLFVSNYHGFCRNILKKHGYIIHENFIDIDKFQSIDDSNFKESIRYGLNKNEAQLLSDYSLFVKKIDAQKIKENFQIYTNIVINRLIPEKVIPFNAILALTIKLLRENPQILEFYKKYFVAILVDEFQDTNFLSWWLLHLFINDNETIKLIFLGDPLQRIYGFIGAVPDLMNKVKNKYNMRLIQLDKNYRFKDNQQMLLLDYNIRKNAENPQNPNIDNIANVKFLYAENQKQEALNIIKQINTIFKNNPNGKIAILTKQRGKNIDFIIDVFTQKSIPYFYGLFTDEDFQYIKFHRECLFQFIELIKNDVIVNKTKLNQLLRIIKETFADNENIVYKSLFKLLRTFKEKVFTDYAFLSNEEKINLIKDTFESNGLKQYIEFIDTNIIFSTVHAAKGLEWDYVIIADMEQYSFPNWPGLCGSCKNQQTCQLIIDNKDIEKKFLEELSVFYVAVTRARKQVYFTASKKDSSEKIKNISCFLHLKGINVGE